MKRCFFLIGLCLMTAWEISAQIPSNGLIAFYPFNGNTNDESGNAYHAQNYGSTPVTDRFSKSANACELDANGSYLVLPQNFDSKPRSINLWFNAAVGGGTGWQQIYSSDNPNLSHGMVYISIFDVNNVPELHIANGNARDTVDISRNAWYNVHLQLGVDSVMDFYLNGQLISSRKYTFNLHSVDGFQNVVLGASRSAANSYFKGLLDDIRIYNRTLNQAEITSIWMDGKTPVWTSICDTLRIKMALSDAGNNTYRHTFSVYPNPAKSRLMIDFGSYYQELGNLSISISNSLGQTLYNGTVNKQLLELDLGLWTGKGLYMLEISESHGKVLERKKILLE